MHPDAFSSSPDAPAAYPAARRLSDLIAQAFFRAHDAGDIVTAGHLLSALESLLDRERRLYPEDRRVAAPWSDIARAHLVLHTTEVTVES